MPECLRCNSKLEWMTHEEPYLIKSPSGMIGQARRSYQRYTCPKCGFILPRTHSSLGKVKK